MVGSLPIEANARMRFERCSVRIDQALMRCWLGQGNANHLDAASITQPDLKEAVTSGRARLDQPSHRLAVAVERPELDVTGVGMGVEVHDTDAASAVVAGNPGHVGERHRVVPSEHHRDSAARRQRRHRLG